MSYGGEFIDAAMNAMGQTYESFARIAHEANVGGNFDGTIYVPAHSVNRGTFAIIWKMEKLSGKKIIAPNVPTQNMATSSEFDFDPWDFPSLSWNEATKQMTIVHTTAPDAFYLEGDNRYRIVFLHYK